MESSCALIFERQSFDRVNGNRAAVADISLNVDSAMF